MFNPAKESMHTVSYAQPHGDSFKLLGVHFDCKLRMKRPEALPRHVSACTAVGFSET